LQWSAPQPSGDPRVLPQYASDSYLILVPGETRLLTIEAPDVPDAGAPSPS
jgi:hypothetical protein